MSAWCRSCNAPIIWAKTLAGKAIPIDAQPYADGNIVLTGTQAAPVANVLDPASPTPPHRLRYKSHFATCPDADRHRKPPLPARGEALRRQIETALGQAKNARELAASPAERAIAATLMSLTNIVAELAEGIRQ